MTVSTRVWKKDIAMKQLWEVFKLLYFVDFIQIGNFSRFIYKCSFEEKLQKRNEFARMCLQINRFLSCVDDVFQVLWFVITKAFSCLFCSTNQQAVYY